MKKLSDIILEKLKVSNKSTPTSQFEIQLIDSYRPLKLSNFLSYISFDEFSFTQYIDDLTYTNSSADLLDVLDKYDTDFADNLIAFINMLLDMVNNNQDSDSYSDAIAMISYRINKQTEPHGFYMRIQASSQSHADGSNLTRRLQIDLTENRMNHIDVALKLILHKD
jgi:hypothetical protein